MNCVVIDDDAIIRKTLKGYIEKTDDLTLLQEFDNPLKALDYIRTNEVDVVFLDIEMPEMTGLDVLKLVNDFPHVVLVSSKSEYAVEGYNYDVVDFLHKPIEYVRFLKSIHKIRDINDSLETSQSINTNIFIKDGTRYIKLDTKSILFIEALGDYVKIQTTDKRFTVLATMKSIERKLSEFHFFRVHRSYIVNINHIKEIEENNIYINDISIPISRSYKQELMEKIKLI